MLTQFAITLTEREGRAYAAWAGARLVREAEKSEGVLALTPRGELLGMMLVEILDDTAEISMPWTKFADDALRSALAQAMLQVLHEEHPDLVYLRAERQLLPGEMHCQGLEAAGFICHWRWRMERELLSWQSQATVPAGYRVARWNVANLDAAADVVFRANRGTLDAEIFAPFFGESPAHCRKGLLAILVGKFGLFLPEATMCAFYGDQFAGVNLVIDESGGMASIVELSVDPAHQHHGLGRTLVSASLTALKQSNFSRVELAVTRANKRAVHLYDSLGFLRISDYPVCVWPREPGNGD